MISQWVVSSSKEGPRQLIVAHTVAWPSGQFFSCFSPTSGRQAWRPVVFLLVRVVSCSLQRAGGYSINKIEIVRTQKCVLEWPGFFRQTRENDVAGDQFVLIMPGTPSIGRV